MFMCSGIVIPIDRIFSGKDPKLTQNAHLLVSILHASRVQVYGLWNTFSNACIAQAMVR